MERKSLSTALLFSVAFLIHLLPLRADIEFSGPQGNVLLQLQPNTEKDTINYGNMLLTVSNYGFFGSEHDLTYPSCMFPAYSNQEYLFWGGLWLGALERVDTLVDTLVSCGCEGWAGPHHQFYPGVTAADGIQARSTRTNDPNYDSLAVSELDFIAVYSDTWTLPSLVGEGHEPLGLEITQKSYCWSYPYAQDLIIFDFWLKNMGQKRLKDLYMGLYIDGDCRPSGAQYGNPGAQDDVTGFLEFLPNGDEWNPKDSVKVAWIANACEVGLTGTVVGIRTPDVTGTRVLRSPNPQLRMAYNWWFSDQVVDKDWGPWDSLNTNDSLLQVYAYEREQQPEPGTPVLDAEKWLMMSNGEFDPDQIEGVVGGPHADTSYDDTRYLLSFGPIWTVDSVGGPRETDSAFIPGDSVPITVAYIGGEGFQIYSEPPDPGTHSEDYYDFLDLGVNARWSLDVYDNPGCTTIIRIEGEDTIYGWNSPNPLDRLFFHWPEPIVDATPGSPTEGDTVDWTGDGIPDFKGPPPPPSPFLKLVPGYQKVTVLWGARDSLYSENTIDPFPPFFNDFEGYKIYRSYSSQEREISGWSLLAQYDREDRWVRTAADSFWVDKGWNIWPPPANPDSNEYYQLDGDSVRFVYAFIDSPVLSYYPVHYSVTAFDFGNPVTDVEPLESGYGYNAQQVIPGAPSKDFVGKKEVMVVPNPYRINVDYDALRWENPDRTGWNEHRRRLDFINLPPQCTIRIYSLGGDLVDEIEHDDELGSSESWNLISRDVQAVVSGIYLFSVEERPSGEVQVGKFVIIK